MLAPLKKLWSKRGRTPDRLRLMWMGIVLIAFIASVSTFVVISARADAVSAISDDHEPAIVAAQEIQTSLAQADAAAANAFLGKGGEDNDQRRRYEQALGVASESITLVATKVANDPELLEDVVTMERAFVEYAGLVESARANNRQNFPIGAAYLEAASDLLETEIYPLTDKIANSKADRYRDSYNFGLNIAAVVLLVVFFLLVVSLLGYMFSVHRYVAKTFRRIINVPLLAGILLVVAVLFWSLFGVFAQISATQEARQEDYAEIKELLNLRSSGFQTKRQESEFLIARGGIADDVLLSGSEAVTAEVSGYRGELPQLWANYVAEKNKVPELIAAEGRGSAINLVLGESDAAFSAFDAEVSARLDDAQQRFDANMAGAESSVRYLNIAGPALLLLGALLSVLGIQQRIREYR